MPPPRPGNGRYTRQAYNGVVRIAQIAPLVETVPPGRYGGTERVVSYLTEELVRLGHEVTLYAAEGSCTSARLVSGFPRAQPGGRLAGRVAPHVLLVESVTKDRGSFDVLHFHIEYLHFPLVRAHRLPAVTTAHGRLDLPELGDIYREYGDMAMIAISDAQRRTQPDAGWRGVVHHGLPPDLYRYDAQGGESLVFLGRASPDKGLEQAIEIARRAGRRLKVAARIDPEHQDYFERLSSLMAPPEVEFLGEVDDRGKQELLGAARALLFPIDWPEPFGLSLIEALACGTPVVAFPRGAVPEVVDHGRTGWIASSVEEAVEGVERAGSLDRAACRAEFESRFTARRMAEDYLRLYERILGGRPEARAWRRPFVRDRRGVARRTA